MLEIPPRGLNVDLENFKRLSPQDRKELIRNVLLKIVKQNSNGITVPQIEKLTNFDARTISKHLEYLTAIREVYKLEMGAKTIIYYPNGKIMHSANKDYNIGDKFFAFSLISNVFGDFVYIQEKGLDMYNTLIVKGGLIIQKEHLGEFIERLSEVNSYANKQQNNS